MEFEDDDPMIDDSDGIDDEPAGSHVLERANTEPTGHNLVASRQPPEQQGAGTSTRLQGLLRSLGCPRCECPECSFDSICQCLTTQFEAFLTCICTCRCLTCFIELYEILQTKCTCFTNFCFRLQQIGFFQQYFIRETPSRVADHSSVQYYSQDSVDWFSVRCRLDKINVLSGEVDDENEGGGTEEEQENQHLLVDGGGSPVAAEADEIELPDLGAPPPPPIGGVGVGVGGGRGRGGATVGGPRFMECVVRWQHKIFGARELCRYRWMNQNDVQTQLEETYAYRCKQLAQKASFGEGFVEGERERGGGGGGEGFTRRRRRGGGARARRRRRRTLVGFEDEFDGEDEDEEEEEEEEEGEIEGLVGRGGGVPDQTQRRRARQGGDSTEDSVQKYVQSGQAVRSFGDLLRDRIFTYTEEDDFVSDEIFQPCKCKSRKNLPSRYRKQENSEGLLSEVRTMYIMASFGNWTIGPSEQHEWRGHEYVLCRIKVYPDGSFDMKPGLSVLPTLMDEDEDDLNEYRARRKKVLPVRKKKVQKYYLTTKGGDTYALTIHLHNDRKKDKRIDIRRREILAQMLEKMRVRHSLGHFEELRKYPRFQIEGLIQKATGFSRGAIFIKHAIHFSNPDVFEILDDDGRVVPESEREICSSATHVSDPRRNPGSGKYECHFGFPISTSFLLKTRPGKYSIQSCQFPALYCEIVEVDFWGRHRVVGYGSCLLPRSPGVHSVSFRCWRPISTVRKNVSRFFLGGQLEMEDITHVRIPKTYDQAYLNKFGFQTTPSGTIDLQFNVIMFPARTVGRRKVF